MPVTNSTPNRGYPLPDPTNYIDGDVARIIAALTAIDTDIAAALSSLLTKAAAAHGHVISDITGLQETLNAIGGGGAGTLNGLTDVDVGSALQNMFLRLGPGGVWGPVVLDASMIAAGVINAARLPSYLSTTALSSAYAAAVHTHAISSITNLQTVLDAKATVAALNALASVVDGKVSAAIYNALVSSLGTASTKKVGTGALNVVQLDADGKLPALNASQLTDLPTSAAPGRLLRAPQIITATGAGTYTPPAGCALIRVELQGAGGGGGGSTVAGGGGGGGAGAYADHYFAVVAGTNYSYANGTGGTAGSGSTDANDGGNSTFTVSGVTITAGGGKGGKSNTLGNPEFGGDGGAATNALFNSPGQPGGVGTTAPNVGGAGGKSFFGAGGGAVTSGNNGKAGSLGGGGSGGCGSSSTNKTGGRGGDGMIRIWEYS